MRPRSICINQFSTLKGRKFHAYSRLKGVTPDINYLRKIFFECLLEIKSSRKKIEFPQILFSWATEIILENLFVLSVKINGIVKQRKSCMFKKFYYVFDNNGFMTLFPFFLPWLSSNFGYHGNQPFLLSFYLVSLLRKKIFRETEAKCC